MRNNYILSARRALMMPLRHREVHRHPYALGLVIAWWSKCTSAAGRARLVAAGVRRASCAGQPAALPSNLAAMLCLCAQPLRTT
jgi:hypothetical protein